MQVGTCLSFCSVLMFQMERILVLRAPLLHEHIARRRCRIATYIVCIGIFLLWLPAIYTFSIHGSGVLPCFYTNEQAGSIDLLKYMLLGMWATFCLLPVTFLPVMDVILVYSIRQISKAHNALNLSKHNETKSDKNISIEIKTAISSIIISIYFTLCLSPNLCWISFLFISLLY